MCKMITGNRQKCEEAGCDRSSWSYAKRSLKAWSVTSVRKANWETDLLCSTGCYSLQKDHWKPRRSPAWGLTKTDLLCSTDHHTPMQKDHQKPRGSPAQGRLAKRQTCSCLMGCHSPTQKYHWRVTSARNKSSPTHSHWCKVPQAMCIHVTVVFQP